MEIFVSYLLCLAATPNKIEITYNNSWGAISILRVSGALCGPVLMSHMWPVKKDPSDLPIRFITTQYILMSRVTSYTYNIHIHSTHAGSYMYLNDMEVAGLLVIFCSFVFCFIMTSCVLPFYFCSIVFCSLVSCTFHMFMHFSSWLILHGMTMTYITSNKIHSCWLEFWAAQGQSDLLPAQIFQAWR